MQYIHCPASRTIIFPGIQLRHDGPLTYVESSRLSTANLKTNPMSMKLSQTTKILSHDAHPLLRTCHYASDPTTSSHLRQERVSFQHSTLCLRPGLNGATESRRPRAT